MLKTYQPQPAPPPNRPKPIEFTEEIRATKMAIRRNISVEVDGLSEIARERTSTILFRRKVILKEWNG